MPPQYAFDLNGQNLYAGTWLPVRHGDVLYEAMFFMLSRGQRRRRLSLTILIVRPGDTAGIVCRALAQPVSGELTLSQTVSLDCGLRSQLAEGEAA